MTMVAATGTTAPARQAGTGERPDDRTLIEQLRVRVDARKAAIPPKPTVDMVTTIVEDLLGAVPLADTAAKTGITPAIAAEKAVLDVVATFGTWLSHSRGRTEVTYRYDADSIQLVLFQVECLGGGIVIPSGYEPSGPHRRDVDRAVCSVIHHRPDAETVARFVNRTYGTRQSVLSYPVVSGVWGFARNGRLSTIDLVSNDLVFQEQVLEAFDLLDVAREDAINAVSSLLAGAPTAADVLRCCDLAYWLDEKSFAMLRTAAESANSSRLDGALDRLRRRVQSRVDAYFPAQVRDLTLGQVRRICTAAGIRVDPETRAEEHDIRATLKQKGFGADADRLVPEALRCAANGQLDAFWAVLDARADGDPTWGEQLQELAAG